MQVKPSISGDIRQILFSYIVYDGNGDIVASFHSKGGVPFSDADTAYDDACRWAHENGHTTRGLANVAYLDSGPEEGG